MKKELRKAMLPDGAIEVDMRACAATMLLAIGQTIARSEDPELVFDRLEEYVESPITFHNAVTSSLAHQDLTPATPAEAKSLLTAWFYGAGAKHQLEELGLTHLLETGEEMPADRYPRSLPPLLRQLRSDIVNVGRAFDSCPSTFEVAGVVKGDAQLWLIIHAAEFQCTKILYEQLTDGGENTSGICCCIHDGVVIDPTSLMEGQLEGIIEATTALIEEKWGWTVHYHFKAEALDDDDKEWLESAAAAAREFLDSLGGGDIGADFSEGQLADIARYESHASRDVYYENLSPKEKTFILFMRNVVERILSDRMKMPTTFAALESQHHCIQSFAVAFHDIWEEFEAMQAIFASKMTEDTAALKHELIAFLDEHECEMATVTDETKAFLRGMTVEDHLEAENEDAASQSSATPSARPKKKYKKVEKKAEVSAKLKRALREMKLLGFEPSRNFTLSTPDWGQIDLDSNIPSPRPEYMMHQPQMSKLFNYSRLPELIYAYYRMAGSGRYYEIRMHPVYGFTQNSEMPVDVFLERDFVNGIAPLPGDKLSQCHHFLLDINEFGKAATALHFKPSAFKFCDFRVSGLALNVGPYPTIHALGNAEMVSTVKFPAYNHLLGDKVQECISHVVDPDVEQILDRFFCHVAGCVRCHCKRCSEAGVGVRCHHCGIHDDGPCLCGESPTLEHGRRHCQRLKLWYAFVIRYPHHPVKKCILFYSPRGGQGKSTLITELAVLLLGHDLALTDKNHAFLTGKFNSAIEGKRMLAINEANLGNDKAALQALTGVIDMKALLIENKGVDARLVPFYGAIACCSNILSTFPPISAESRKFDGYWCADKTKRPGYEAEVLTRIHQEWLDENISKEAKTQIVFEIISYLVQVDPEIEHAYLPDTLVWESPLLTRLADFTPLSRSVHEFVDEFVTPLMYYMEQKAMSNIAVLVNTGTNNPIPGAILQQTKTLTALKDVIQARDGFGAVMKAKECTDAECPVVCVEKHIITPSNVVDSGEENWPFRIKFFPAGPRECASNSHVLFIVRSEMVEALEAYEAHQRNLQPSHL